MSAVLDVILDDISALSLQDQELLDNILHKRIIEEKRDAILEDYKESMNNYERGNSTTGTASDLFDDIDE